MKATLTLLTALLLAPLAALHAAELTSLSLLKDIRVPSSAPPIRTAAQNAEPAKLDAWAQPLAAEPPAPWLEKHNIFEARTNGY